MLQIGVLMGGRGIENEVSFNSGRTICDHLDTSCYGVIPIFQTRKNKLFLLPWRFLYRGKISDFEHRLSNEATEITWDDLKEIVDFVYISTHGRYAEDGTLQGMLELLNIPYLGSKILASAIGMDKIMQKKWMQMDGISVPQDIVVTPQEIISEKFDIATIIERMQKAGFAFPCVVKPYKEGSSLGISVVRDKDKLYSAIHHAAAIDTDNLQKVLVEEYIDGMEFCFVALTDHETGSMIPLSPTEVIPEGESDFFDYDQKYMPGRATKFTPARCSAEETQKIQETCLKVIETLDMTNIVRIDGFLAQDGRVVIIDPNTLTGMAPSSFLFRQAAEIDMNHTYLINHLIETELRQYGNKEVQKKKPNQDGIIDMNKKIRVAVLLGGPSNEKEISLESGRNIAYKLSPQKYEPIPIFVDSQMNLFKINEKLLVCHSTKEIEEGLDPAMKIKWNDLPTIAEFVFIGLHGGEGENGAVQGALEMLGIPYNGSSVLTSALCMDKFKTNQFLQKQGFDIPKGILISKQDWTEKKDHILNKIITTKLSDFPLIVKPHDDGCSMMVQKATSPESLSKAIELILHEKEHVLVEECISGMELTVGVIGNDNPTALVPSQAVVSKGILTIEEKFLPGAGENQTPAQLPQESLSFIQNTIKEAFIAVGCQGYARIDCFYQGPELSPTGKERVIIIEINTLPGMTPATVLFHQAAEIEMKPMDLVDRIIQYGFEAHRSHNEESTATGTIHSTPTELDSL